MAKAKAVAATPTSGEVSVGGGMSITIPPVNTAIVEIEVEGVTQLLVNAWSHKARQQMLDKQMKKAKQAKEAKNPEQDYLSSLYTSTEGWTGIPASGVKGCLVNACRAVDDLPMTVAKRMIFVRGQGKTEKGVDLVRVYGKHEMHEAMVRLDNGGTADIRYRACYPQWSMKLEIEFLPNIISAEMLANLVSLAGFIEGLCEHRPGSPKSCTGTNGRFRIKSAA